MEDRTRGREKQKYGFDIEKRIQNKKMVIRLKETGEKGSGKVE